MLWILPEKKANALEELQSAIKLGGIYLFLRGHKLANLP